MSDLNIIAVKQNILKEMNKRGYKQKDIVRITGMPQSNVSKALNISNKKMFTVDQLYKLAEDFNISLDELLGTKNMSTDSDPSLEEISSFLVRLFETGHLRHCKCTVKEKYPAYIKLCALGHDLGDYDENSGKEVTYDAFYFSNAASPVRTYNLDPTNDEPDTLWDNQELNIFLLHFLKVFDLYAGGILPKEAYDFAVKGYLDVFKKYTDCTLSLLGSLFGS